MSQGTGVDGAVVRLGSSSGRSCSAMGMLGSSSKRVPGTAGNIDPSGMQPLANLVIQSSPWLNI